MKKTWVQPSINVQEFEANEYVAACVVGTIACAIPGPSATKVDGSSPTRRDGNGMLHGLCGNTAEISFNAETASGFERLNGRAMTNRPIFSVSGYALTPGTYENVSWQSTDGDNNTGTYTHTGTLVIDYIDNNRPNHS